MFSKDQKAIAAYLLNKSFNPCCNGMFSKVSRMSWENYSLSFNPCCNGMFSKEKYNNHENKILNVLILVVMECFRKSLIFSCFQFSFKVLWTILWVLITCKSMQLVFMSQNFRKCTSFLMSNAEILVSCFL